MKKNYYKFLSIVFVFIFVLSIIVPLREVFTFNDGFLASYEDVEIANEDRKFGSFINTQIEEKEMQVDGQKRKKNEIVFKLFGFIPIRRVSVNLCEQEEFYLGGMPIGLSICSDGAIVVSNDGNSSLEEGDIITHIAGQKIESLEQIPNLLNDSSSEEVEVEYLHKNKAFKSLIKTTKDEDKHVKLGLWVKDDINGVGTLTFVNKKTHKYGALGHPIVEANSGNIIPVSTGKIVPCNLIGINKGRKNAPGELRCIFATNSKSKGSIENNYKFGINGVITDLNGLVDENLTVKVGGRLGVRLGKAKIVSSVSGITEEYDIEIIKANYQKNASDKSLVFRVKDKRLLNLTGGIVQGMSGSPIIQDGKLIGAVTHVFLNDPTKGFGVYADFMLQ